MTSEEEKEQFQQQMERSREALATTVGEIKETVEVEVEAVKETVSSVMNFRDEFQKEPLVWSLGALSAGFALGYTVGYTHKKTKSKKNSEITAFADNMIRQLSAMGNGMVLPVLDAKISELFGFKFSSMLAEVRNGNTKSASRKKVMGAKKASTNGRGKQTRSRSKKADRKK